MTGIIFMVVAWLFVLVAEVCKCNAFYRATSIFRVFGMLYATAFIVYGFGNPADFQATFGHFPHWLMSVFGLAGGYNAGLFVLELYRPRKYYTNYLDVPRQVLYKVGKYGKCQVLSEREAKKAHENGETVYIHAMARVTYKPKDEEPQNPNINKGSGTDINGHTVLKTMQQPHQPPQLSEDALIKLKELREKLGQIKGIKT